MLNLTSAPLDSAAFFFVKKENGKLCFIVEARSANHRFAKPPDGGASAGDALASLELAEGE
eukprot:7448449-Heterocapsa_arctica.AAC.1